MNEQNDALIKTDIPARERLIFALDVPDLDQARFMKSSSPAN